MATRPNVLGIFAAPSRDDTLKAISKALLRIRSEQGLTCEKIGKALGVSSDTIENATNEKSLLGFEAIALLGFYFPDEFRVIEELWTMSAAPEPSPVERIDRVERELEALRKLVA